MSAPIKYRQCRLEKAEGGDRLERTLWLPVRYAVKGDVVKLRDNGVWSDGWRVTSASGMEIDEKYAVHTSHAHTRQRRASDI
jgi:hypothetical protein